MRIDLPFDLCLMDRGRARLREPIIQIAVFQNYGITIVGLFGEFYGFKELTCMEVAMSDVFFKSIWCPV